jgi:hypothetical protein
MPKRDSGLRKAIEVAGSHQQLATMLRISLQAVWQWRRVPPLRVLQVEGVTGIARHELRPDLYPPPRARRKPHQLWPALLAKRKAPMPFEPTADESLATIGIEHESAFSTKVGSAFHRLSEVGQAALGYAERGCPVFPCSPVDKSPLVENGFKNASTDPEQICTWWRKWPNAMIGVPTGPRRGFVIDLDPKKQPAGAMLQGLAKFCGGLHPAAWICRTPSGGYHVYFAYPDLADGRKLGSRTNLFKHTPGVDAVIKCHVDVKGEGGYVIVPPSVREDGKAYSWEQEPNSDLLPEAPAVLLDVILRRGTYDHVDSVADISLRSTAIDGPGDKAVRQYALKALDKELRAVASAPEGERNNTLNIAAVKIASLVAAGALSQSKAWAALGGAARHRGLRTREVHQTIKSGFRKGLSEPRDLSEIRRRAEERARSTYDTSQGQARVPENTSPDTTLSESSFSVEEMNRQWALVMVGSHAVMMREQPDAPLEDRVRVIKIRAFQQWYANRFTEIRDPDNKAKTVTWASAWLGNPRRRQYQGLEFYPDPQLASGTPGYFNTWRGFSVAPRPKADGYAIFRDHLFNNVCDSDPSLFQWVFGFFAQMIQQPRKKPGAALVLRGGMGAGKTKVGEVIGSLFPENFFLVDSARYLTGHFNMHMASCLLLQADEAVWAGNKEAEGHLRGLITSDEQMIEPKGIDAMRLKNYARVMMTSNEDWVVPAGKEERRFCVLDVNPRRLQDTLYFQEMDEELNNGGREALLHDLLTFDLSSVNLRQIPRTGALLEQKIHSLDPIDSWWLDRLMAGTPTRKHTSWLPVISSDLLREDYIESANQMGIKRKSTETVLGRRLKNLTRGLGLRRAKRMWSTPNGDKRVSCYLMPSLAACREAFEKALGQRIDWDELDEQPTPFE